MRSDSGIIVQRWLHGEEPSTDIEWNAVADELKRLHATTQTYPQRPGCCTVHEIGTTRRSVDADLDALPANICAHVVAAFAEVAAAPTSVIHGDPHGPNIRVAPNGNVGLLDWDESRVDVSWHDLSNLAIQVLDDDDQALATRLSHAWEAVNAWVVEPDYARRRMAELIAF